MGVVSTILKRCLILLFIPGVSFASSIVNPGSGGSGISASSASLSYLGISSTTAGSISLSSASVSYTAISSVTLNPFVSTFSATDLNGFKIYASSGSIGANTSITLTIPNTTQIWFPLCTELEGTNTAVLSVRVKSITSNSWIVYNADAINAKNYICWVFSH